MSVSFVQKVAEVSGNNNTTRNLTMPSTAGPPSVPTNGNLLVVVGATGETGTPGSTFTPATNNGGFVWPQIDVNSGFSSSKLHLASGYRFALNESGVVYLMTNAPSRPIEYCMLEYSGIDGSAPIDTSANGLQQDHDVSSLTALVAARAGCKLLVAVVMSTAANVVTGITASNCGAFTQRENIVTTAGSNDPNLYIFDADVLSSGSTGTINIGFTGSIFSNTAAAMLIYPPASAGAAVHRLLLTGVGK